jgi:hypothetical protein
VVCSGGVGVLVGREAGGWSVGGSGSVGVDGSWFTDAGVLVFDLLLSYDSTPFLLCSDKHIYTLYVYIYMPTCLHIYIHSYIYTTERLLRCYTMYKTATDHYKRLRPLVL